MSQGVNEKLYEKVRTRYLEQGSQWWGLSWITTTDVKPL